ncbi:saccharopine dehydrogenase family protein [Alkalimarinus sediminis]|uniref:Saccharopine dehydrogenase NADP-binding domain-containing protein n=1 Tax=Alkalimarinus sediminis TaxID=1632866 RepID=A0A9E8HJ52_9ALTE|nr:saccharopine dehydrogenase NADP-binding domain-containing protein [Alkalimarinus sediminis]UZW74307.1 saccharopine dehydrogenase NADP-binding domain-containing protein [Alkalimarinus sediminis]
MSTQQFDLIIFGATSFVGQLVCHYLNDQYGVNGNIKWAIAGRSQAKLETLKNSLGSKAKELTLLTADAADQTALTNLCEQTKVIISTVGPYALYGEPLIKICADTGTDYCDLTGEVQWVNRMIRRYEHKAQQTGARIIHCCGFDSIPSDMGVYHLQQHAIKQFGEPCSTVRMRVKAMRGAASGGTIASMINITKEAARSKELRKELANPYSICPQHHGFTARQTNITTPELDPVSGQWAGPFIMAGINTRVVHRSNALSNNAYGTQFKYDESMLMGKGIKGRLAASGFGVGIGVFLAGAAIKPTRWLMENYMLPKPGEGPSPSAQEKGFYDIRFFGKTEKGETIQTKVTGDRDPGYGSTSKMLAEAGISLAHDISKSEKTGGFWTTATIFDQRFIDRLEQKAGLTFSTI